jgi:hypothetical protein
MEDRVGIRLKAMCSSNALRKLGETAQAIREFGLANQMRLAMPLGLRQGMGKMRPHLPELDW